MTAKYYRLIIEMTKQFIGKIDGDDVAKITRIIDDLIFDDETVNYNDLIFELNDITNAMWCEHGLDYGATQDNWDDTVLEILNVFKNGYTRNENDLNILIQLILKGIKE